MHHLITHNLVLNSSWTNADEVILARIVGSWMYKGTSELLSYDIEPCTRFNTGWYPARASLKIKNCILRKVDDTLSPLRVESKVNLRRVPYGKFDPVLSISQPSQRSWIGSDWYLWRQVTEDFVVESNVWRELQLLPVIRAGFLFWHKSKNSNRFYDLPQCVIKMLQSTHTVRESGMMRSTGTPSWMGKRFLWN